MHVVIVQNDGVLFIGQRTRFSATMLTRGVSVYDPFGFGKADGCLLLATKDELNEIVV